MNTYQQLREQLVNFLETNQHTADGIHMVEWIPNQDWDSYLAEMRKDGVWGMN